MYNVNMAKINKMNNDNMTFYATCGMKMRKLDMMMMISCGYFL